MKSDMICINAGFVLDDTKTDTRSPRPYLCRALSLKANPTGTADGSSSGVTGPWFLIQREGEFCGRIWKLEEGIIPQNSHLHWFSFPSTPHLLEGVFQPAHGLGRVQLQDLAGHQPVKQDAKRRQALFDGGRGQLALQVLNESSDVDRLHLGELTDAVMLTPSRKAAGGIEVGPAFSDGK